MFHIRHKRSQSNVAVNFFRQQQALLSQSHQGEYFFIVESIKNTQLNSIFKFISKVESWCEKLRFKNLCTSVWAESFLTWRTSHQPKRITLIAFSMNAITSKYVSQYTTNDSALHNSHLSLVTGSASLALVYIRLPPSHS